MRQLKIVNRITNRESLSLELYLSDIGKIALLTPEEEVRLANRVREGDQEALEEMTKANLRFVVSVAKQYQHHGVPLSDLINEGNMGLMKAAQRFDEKRGFKFISYAVWWIRQSVVQSVMMHGRVVRVPSNRLAAFSRVNKAYSSFVQELEREPTHEELGDLLNMSAQDIAEILKDNARHVSFDAPMTNAEDELTMLDVMPSQSDPQPDSNLILEGLMKDVAEGISSLAPREQDIINQYYGLNGAEAMSLEEIAEKYELTRERVRQLKDRAIRRLRRSTNSTMLKSYLNDI